MIIQYSTTHHESNFGRMKIMLRFINTKQREVNDRNERAKEFERDARCAKVYCCRLRDFSSEWLLSVSPLIQASNLSQVRSWSLCHWSCPCGAASRCNEQAGACSGTSRPNGWASSTPECLRRNAELFGRLRKSMDAAGSCCVRSRFAMARLRIVDVAPSWWPGCTLASSRCCTRYMWKSRAASCQPAARLSYPCTHLGRFGSHAQNVGEHSVTISWPCSWGLWSSWRSISTTL